MHSHEVNGQIFDKDCVAVIKAPTYEEGDAIAFKLFHGVFHGHYPEPQWQKDWIKYYPRGYIEVRQ